MKAPCGWLADDNCAVAYAGGLGRRLRLIRAEAARLCREGSTAARAEYGLRLAQAPPFVTGGAPVLPIGEVIAFASGCSAAGQRRDLHA